MATRSKQSERHRLLVHMLQMTGDVTGAGTFHHHAATGRFECDAQLAHLFGWPEARTCDADELRAQIHPDDLAELIAGWERCARDGTPLAIEHRIVLSDGRVRWVALLAEPHRCDVHGPACIIGACTDVTARRGAAAARAERDALAQAERWLRRVTDAIPQLMWTADPDGVVDYANQRWTAYTGRDGGRGLSEAFHPEDRVAVGARWRRALGDGEPFDLEARIVGRDGAARWFLVQAAPIKAPGGAIVRWVGTCTDVDDRRRAEAQVIEANRAKDEFLAMLGHELRNPLTPIVAALHLLEQRGDPAIERERTTIERQVRHLVRLVDDLLDLGRISQGKIHLERGAIDAAIAVEHAIETCAPQLAERHHALVVDVPRRLFVRGDAQRLTQVFANLIGNAAKYTPPGGQVTVRAARAVGEVVVTVADDGIGIEPDLLPRVFDPFTQGSRSPDRTDAGLGLGLTIVRRLIEMHGGAVTVESGGAGAGSTFTVRLPATAAPVEDAPAPARAAPAPAATRRVLVVDDRADVTELFTDILRSEGHTVASANTPFAALAIAEAFRPDVALIDLGLPEMDGCELARELRARLGAACPTMIAITGYGQEHDRARAARAGFAQHLVKPVEMRTLLDAVTGDRRGDAAARSA